MFRLFRISFAATVFIAFNAYTILLPRAQGQTMEVPVWTTMGQPGGWSSNSPDYVSIKQFDAQPSYLEIAVPPQDFASTAWAMLDLPLDTYRGTIVTVSVEARIQNVSRPVHAYNGVKAMVHGVDAAVGDIWEQAGANPDNYPGNYGWKTLTFQAHIPLTATRATLLLGLQESSGTADFRNPTIEIVRKAVQLPKNPSNGPVFTGHGPGALRGVMVNTDTITPADIEVLKKWHVNLIRWQLTDAGWQNSAADTQDAAAYDRWLNSALKRLDRMLPYFRKAGILVALDLHTGPGGLGSGGVNRIFTSAQWQDHFIACWENMAAKYRGEKQIWGYDLINEPHEGGTPKGLLNWRDLAEETALQMRKIDPGHAIIVEPSAGLAYFQPLTVPGIVYSIHTYDPMAFTCQGAFPGTPLGTRYPSEIGGILWNKEQIRASMQEAEDYAKAFHVQIYVGEFSASRLAPGADLFLRDLIDMMEENGWDWSYHAFRENSIWSLEVGEDPKVSTPSPAPTARFKVVEAAFAKNIPRK